MEINATLFAQLVHFLLAYILIDRIVLRLAVAMVKAEDRKLGALEAETAEHEKRIASRIRYNDDDWVILKKRLQSECPSVQVGQHVHVVHEEPLPCPPLREEDIKEFAGPLKQMLINTILVQQDDHD